MGKGLKLVFCVVDFIIIKVFEAEPLFSFVYEDIWDEEENDE